MSFLHNPAQPASPWPRACVRGDGIEEVGAECRAESATAQRGGCEFTSAPKLLCWKGSHSTGGSPRRQLVIFVCWFLVLSCRRLFGNPSPPSHGLRDVHECVQIHARVREPAATGWTVFVNLLETSQYSPELHLLHALKLTVQATRMTLTDLVQYNVF